jgi:Pyridoxamine 5'-phosphate oxidase
MPRSDPEHQVPAGSWADLEQEAPAIARLGRRLLGTGIAFLATVRRDGSPRLHPVCPLICDGELLLGIIDRSPKRADLRRDPRCVVHAVPGPGHAEFWVRAVAEPQGPAVARRWADRDRRLALPDGDTLFRLGLVVAYATIFGPGADGRPVPDRRSWRSRRTPAGAGRAAAAAVVTR